VLLSANTTHPTPSLPLCRMQVCPRANVLTPEAVADARRQGLSVRAWGVKTLELLDRVVECGAQGATANWPAQAAARVQGC